MSETSPVVLAPYRSIVDALLILVRDNHVLLAQRQGTEGLEEIGIQTTEGDLEFVHLIHYRNHLGDARIGVFFRVLDWQGEPYNVEPHKCSQIRWWPVDRLPAGTYPYTAEGIRAYKRGEPFSLVGWQGERS